MFEGLDKAIRERLRASRKQNTVDCDGSKTKTVYTADEKLVMFLAH